MSSSSNRLWPLCSSTHLGLSFSSRRGLFGFTQYPLLLLLWGHGLARRKPQKGHLYHLSDSSFFERGYHTFLAGGLGDPEKTIRKGPELPHFLASSRHSKSLRLLIGLRFYTASYYRLPILWSLGKPLLYTQKNSSTLGTPDFSSLVLTFRPGYIQSTARGNSPIWNGIGL